MDDLTALEDWLAPLLAKLQPSERRKLARNIARDLRRSQAQRIAAQLNPDGSGYVPRKPQLRDRKGEIRRKMFAKIRQASHLKALANADEATVGFGGRVARIAAVHQYGLRERVSRHGPELTYPVRRLIGFTQVDLDRLRSIVMLSIVD